MSVGGSTEEESRGQCLITRKFYEGERVKLSGAILFLKVVISPGGGRMFKKT